MFTNHKMTAYLNFLQSKVDVIGMYHAIAKDLIEFNGGSDLVRGMAQYVQGKPKKFKVITHLMTGKQYHNMARVEVHIS